MTPSASAHFWWTSKPASLPRVKDRGNVLQVTATRLMAVRSRHCSPLWLIISLFVCAGFFPAFGHAKLSVYLDCKKRSCDSEFIRRELAFLDFVRDPKDAEVHALITKQRSASGRRFELLLYGVGSYAGQDFNLQVATPNDASTDEERRAVLNKLKLGLIPYLLTTDLADSVSVSFNAPTTQTLGDNEDSYDPWNHWVFRSEVGGRIENEDSRKLEETWTSFSANRVTEDWRLGVNVGHKQKDRRFILEDESELEDNTTRTSITAAAIKSLSPKWSVGVGASGQQSTFRNLDLGQRVAAAVEYNIFPYRLSAEKALTFGYFLGATNFSYEATTVFGVLEETRADHGLFAELDIAQTWGDASIALRSAQMLDDPSLYRVTVGGNLSYRIARGLSVSVWGESSLVKDQIYLANASASTSDILLGSAALNTDTETKLGVSLRYTFGSIYNNVVNNRLQGASFARIF